MMTNSAQHNTINDQEVEQFQQLADLWWDETGPFKPLHRFNPCRLAYIRDMACTHFGKDPSSLTPLEGLSVLDIGCGGGLLSEPMAKMGADVTGIDAGEKNVEIAKLHAQQNGVNINYQSQTVEGLLASQNSEGTSVGSAPTGYDIILNMEVVEHVENVPLFLESSAKLLNTGGIMFVATLNRTLKSYALAIVGAEYILRWLPRGTHDWNKFLKPSEIASHLQSAPVTLADLTGCSYNPLTATWKRSNDVDVNYIMLWKKGE